MAFGLQYDIQDRALPDALRSPLVQQTEVLETLLRYTQDTIQTIQANGDMPSQGKKRQVDALVHEVSEQLSVLEDPHTQSERQFEAFQTMLRR